MRTVLDVNPFLAQYLTGLCGHIASRPLGKMWQQLTCSCYFLRAKLRDDIRRGDELPPSGQVDHPKYLRTPPRIYKSPGVVDDRLSYRNVRENESRHARLDEGL